MDVKQHNNNNNMIQIANSTVQYIFVLKPPTAQNREKYVLGVARRENYHLKTLLEIYVYENTLLFFCHFAEGHNFLRLPFALMDNKTFLNS